MNECEEILRQPVTSVVVLASHHHTFGGVARLFNQEDNFMGTTQISSSAQLWRILQPT